MGHLSLLSSFRIRRIIVLAGALALCGCNRIQVLVGAKVYIAKLPVTSMQITLPNGPAVAPGEKIPLVATFTASDGKIWTTEGKGKGKILWSDIAVTASVVTVKKGVVSLPHDPRVSEGKTGHLVVTVPSHPDLHAELDVPLRYDYPFAASYSGSNGMSGNNGTDGTNGTDGFPGSIDPDNPSPGGNGGNGGNGSDGSDGQPGSDGPSVEVRVTLLPAAHPLLQASVQEQGANKPRFYLIDPQGGSLTVRSVGGSGGSGGTGGRAGRGGSGGSGIPSGSAGSDGLAGHDGSRGSDGRDGKITVVYDPAVVPYLTVIHASYGGNSPKLVEQPVPPLW